MSDDFDSWYRELRPPMGAALTVWAGDRGLANDALDEAFTRAFSRWDRVQAMDSPSGWVWRSATNLVRRRGRRAAMEQRLLTGVARQSDGAGRSDIEADIDLRRALGLLTERQRTAVVLHYIGDLSHQQVAQIMSVAPGTVGATIHQAKARLAELLAEGPHHDRDGAENGATADRPRNGAQP